MTTLNGGSILFVSLVGLARNIAAMRMMRVHDLGLAAIAEKAVRELSLAEQSRFLAGDGAAIARVRTLIIRFFEDADASRNHFMKMVFEAMPLGTSACRDQLRDSPGAGTEETVSDGTSPTLNGDTCHCYLKDGLLHRDPTEGPAFSVIRPDGSPASIFYLVGGLAHRPASEGPAMTEFDDSGALQSAVYFEQGKLSRDPAEGPALYCRSQGFERHEFYLNGRRHRPEDAGPAYISVSPEAMDALYYFEGECHRTHGPAITRRSRNGTPLIETWFRHGVCHRDPSDGPAVMHWSEDGMSLLCQYWCDGAEVAPL